MQKEEAIKAMRRWRHERPEYWVVADDMYNWTNTREKRELVLLFSIMVAGKSADRTSDILNYMMHTLEGDTPFNKIGRMVERGDALERLKTFRIGQHNRILKAFREAIDFDVDATPPDPEELRRIPGIGLKTSRFVALVYDRTLPVAVLDTHMLKFLRHIEIDAPTSTPGSCRIYERLSTPIVRLAELLAVAPGDLDIAIWRCGKKGLEDFPKQSMAEELGVDQDKLARSIAQAVAEYREVSP